MDRTHVERISRLTGRRAADCLERADGAALAPSESGGKPPRSKTDA